MLSHWSVKNHDINNLFEGFAVSRLRCTHCHNETRAWETYGVVSISMDNSKAENKLNDLLARWRKWESLEDEGLRCKFCKLPEIQTKRLSFSSLSEILVLHLKRFEHSDTGKKSVKKVQYKEYLNMSENRTNAYISIERNCCTHRKETVLGTFCCNNERCKKL